MKTTEMTHEQWLEERRKGLGGSDASVIMGVNPWKSPFDLWMEKTGEFIQDISNERMYWGNVLEDVVAKEFMLRTGKKVRRKNAILQHPEYEWMLGNLDRVVIGEKALLECKTTSAFNNWDEVPDYYYAQVQHYMAVTGYEKAYLAVLIGGQEYKDFEIPRNQPYIDGLIEAEKEFWQMVQDKTPPELDGSESCTKIINSKYPGGNKEEIDLPMDAFTLIGEYEEAKHEEKEAKTRKDAATNKLKDMLGNNETGRIYDRKITWSTFKKVVVDTDKLKLEPELYSKYTKEQNQRRFTIK